MDINCTNRCFYQYEGKCTLRDLPSLTAAQADYVNCPDCPYCSAGAGTGMR